MRRSLLLAATLAAACAIPRPAPAPPPPRPEGPHLHEIFLRDLRTPSGRIDRPVLARGADDLAVALSREGGLPLDVWLEIAGPAPRLVARPAEGALAQAVAGRLAAAAGRPPLRLAWPPEAAPAGRPRPVVVLAPTWQGGAATPSAVATVQALTRAGYGWPAALLVDLTEPLVDGQRVALDIVAGTDDARAADFLAAFTLGARARGRIEAPEPLARKLSLPLATLRWEKRAVIDRLRGRPAFPATLSRPTD